MYLSGAEWFRFRAGNFSYKSESVYVKQITAEDKESTLGFHKHSQGAGGIYSIIYLFYLCCWRKC